MSLIDMASTKLGATVRSLKSRSIGASIAAFGLLLGFGVSGASANPTPDSGPTTGGTTVVLPAPEFKFTKVGTGWAHSTATGSNGQVYSWGVNQRGELGDGTTDPRNTPGLASAPAGVSLSGIDTTLESSLAIGSDGFAYTWPTNDSMEPTKIPQGEVPNGVHLIQVSTSDSTHAALGSDGQIYTWGGGTGGSLGNGSMGSSDQPVHALTPAGVSFVSVAVSDGNVVAAGSDGKVYAWGTNPNGQLGDGTTTSSPLPIQSLPGAIPAGVKIVQVSSGEGFTAALGDDGSVYTWGMNANRQLGDGTNVARHTPVKVEQGAIPNGVKLIKVSAGAYYAMALGDDGRAYAWGGSNSGMFLGNDSIYQSAVPIAVEAGEIPNGVKLIDIDTSLYSEGRHTVALGSNGRAYAWGDGASGELGNGKNLFQTTPVEVLSPEVVVTGVTFDGLAGTSLSGIDEHDMFTVVTPERHPAGKVDVVVSWTLGGVAQTPITYPLGFEYLANIEITNPADQEILVGQNASFSVTPTSYPTPGTVTWQVSADDGATWQPITADTLASLSEGGNKVTITNAPLSHSGRLYRAMVTSLDGTAISKPAKLTVIDPGGEVAANPTPPSTNIKIPNKLPSTGGFSIWYLVTGMALLMAGTGVTVTARLRRSEIK